MGEKRKYLLILFVFVSVFVFIGTAWSQISLPTAVMNGSIPNPPSAIGSQLTFNITTGTVNYRDATFADLHAQDNFIGSSVNILSGGLRTGPMTFSSASIEIRDLDGTHVYITADLIDPLTGDITFTGSFPVYFLNIGLNADDPDTFNLSNVVLFPDPVGHPSKFMDEMQLKLGENNILGLTLNCTGDLEGNVPGFDCLLNNGILQGGNMPVSTPAMTQWGMIIFMVLAGFGSIYYIRGKRIKT